MRCASVRTHRYLLCSLALILTNLQAQDKPPARPESEPHSAEHAAPARRPAKTSSAGNSLATYVNPNTVSEIDTYSKAAVVLNSGKTVYFSGSIPLDKAFNVIGKGDLRAQTKQCLKNLELVMKAANVTKEDVVKLGVNIVYKGNTDSFVVSEELQNFFERDEMPATTMTGAPYLIADGILVQIEAIAVTKN